MKKTFTCTYLLVLGLFMCSKNKNEKNHSEFKNPIVNHDVSYTPFNENLDNPDFRVCDSTDIRSGRNRLKYIGGIEKLEKDICNSYKVKTAYKSFSGFIVIRFIVNCKNRRGRYRVQSLDYNFSPKNASSDIADYVMKLIKGLNQWEKSTSSDPETEYSKFINIRIENGQIKHILL